MAVIYSAPIEQFDFARMARAMAILRWYWGDHTKRTPSENELVIEAHRLLSGSRRSSALHGKDVIVSSGGLIAHQGGLIEFESICKGDKKVLDAWEKAKQ